MPLLLLLLLLLLLPDGLPAAGTSIEAAADAHTHPQRHTHAKDIDPADEQVQKQRGHDRATVSLLVCAGTHLPQPRETTAGQARRTAPLLPQ